MNFLRKSHINFVGLIPLTYEESAEGFHNLENPTWLPEHREQPWTHPHARDVPAGEEQYYHLYCQPKGWLFSPPHWSIFKNGFGYNPRSKKELGGAYHFEMYIPYWQRQVIRNSWNDVEIFEN